MAKSKKSGSKTYTPTPQKKNRGLAFKIIMVILAVALAAGIIIMPIESSLRAYAEEAEGKSVTVEAFETGKLADAVSEAANGTDYNFITKICVMSGTLDASDWSALNAIPNLEYVELAKTDTEDGIIPDNALPYRNQLRFISLPKNTVEIGDSAFNSNRKLEKISMPNTVAKVGNNAFEACEALTEMPNSVGITSFGESAFKDCKSFESFTVSPEVTEIPANAFGKCGFSEIIIGPSVTSVGDGAFADCNNLTDIYVYAENAPSVNASSAFMNVGGTVHVYPDSAESYTAWEYNNLKITGDLDGEYPVEAPDPAEVTEAAEAEGPSKTEAAVTEETSAETEQTEQTEAAETAETSAPQSGLSVGIVIVIVAMAVVIAVLATILVMKSKKS